MKYILSLLFLLAPAICGAQVQVHPAALQYGELPVAAQWELPGGELSFTRLVRVTNTSAGVIEVTAVREVYATSQTVARVAVLSARGGVLQPGEWLYVRYRVRGVTGGLPLAPYHYADTVRLHITDRATGEAGEEQIPVAADFVPLTEPVVVADRGDFYAPCLCEFSRYSVWQPVNIWILNPEGNGDTLTMETVQMLGVEGELQVGFRLDSDIKTYDTIGRPWTYVLPATLFPGMPGLVQAFVPNIPGQHSAIVRFTVRGPGGNMWVREDTLLVIAEPGYTEEGALAIHPSDTLFTLFLQNQQSDNNWFAIEKCGLADTIPLWLDTVYFAGPRAPALGLLPYWGADTLPALPHPIQCAYATRYRVGISRGELPHGRTTDTIVAHYHYNDPEQGRVEGVHKRKVTILLEGTTDVPGGPNEPATPQGMLAAYPNPAHGRLLLVWRGEAKGGVQVRLYNMVGQEVQVGQIAIDENGMAELNTSLLPAGAYRAVAYNKPGEILATTGIMIVP